MTTNIDDGSLAIPDFLETGKYVERSPTLSAIGELCDFFRYHEAASPLVLLDTRRIPDDSLDTWRQIEATTTGLAGGNDIFSQVRAGMLGVIGRMNQAETASGAEHIVHLAHMRRSVFDEQQKSPNRITKSMATMTGQALAFAGFGVLSYDDVEVLLDPHSSNTQLVDSVCNDKAFMGLELAALLLQQGALPELTENILETAKRLEPTMAGSEVEFANYREYFEWACPDNSNSDITDILGATAGYHLAKIRHVYTGKNLTSTAWLQYFREINGRVAKLSLDRTPPSSTADVPDTSKVLKMPGGQKMKLDMLSGYSFLIACWMYGKERKFFT